MARRLHGRGDGAACRNTDIRPTEMLGHLDRSGWKSIEGAASSSERKCSHEEEEKDQAEGLEADPASQSSRTLGSLVSNW